MTEQNEAPQLAPPHRLLGRRRRANAPGGRQHRHEVKVSPAEEQQLAALAEAQRVTVPRLLVESTLYRAGETPAQRREALEMLFGLHRLLGGVANNVNQIARATNATGEVQESLAAALSAARRTCERIDAAVDELAMR